MRNLLASVLIIGLVSGLTGCGGGSDEAVPDAPEAVEETAASTESDTSTVSLPEGLPQAVPILPGLVITESEVLNADLKQFRIKGDSEMDVDQVLDYYLKLFEAEGWEEDSVMAQPANIICSFIKDGLLVFVDANTGGIGSIVEIITGIQD
ncbi:MAG: hypothetical protein COA73_10080 [Candidatus Hydrogenedentota bacterium]|nr:MAG: hypothetical protein COA73_10080 [Candidatus Hydrogenedentota bacterium]